MARPILRLGTRASLLARAQSAQIAALVQEQDNVDVELVNIRTDGDVRTEPLQQLARENTPGLFVGALRQALLDGTVDCIVHSLKDLPTLPLAGVRTVAIPQREDPRDVLCGPHTWSSLPQGSRIGTGSPRRAAQMLALRPDVEIVALRGNVDSRLQRLQPENAEPLDAVILAAAGLERLGRNEAVSEFFDFEAMMPAPGQGALSIEMRGAGEEEWMSRALRKLDDLPTRLAVTAERALLAQLEAGCVAPVGALARCRGDRITLKARVMSPDGRTVVEDQAAAAADTENSAMTLGRTLGKALLASGARALW